MFYFWQCLFFRQDAGGNRSAGAIVLPVKHSVSWHDAIQTKSHFVRKTLTCSWCSGQVLRLLCQWLPVRLSPCLLQFFFSLLFFRLRLGATFRGQYYQVRIRLELGLGQVSLVLGQGWVSIRLAQCQVRVRYRLHLGQGWITLNRAEQAGGPCCQMKNMNFLRGLHIKAGWQVAEKGGPACCLFLQAAGPPFCAARQPTQNS